MRKGRLDELFFVDLPGPEVREAIICLHMRKRGLEPERFDVPLLAQVSGGFSGAELEQAVVSAWHSVRSLDDGDGITTDTLVREIQRTQPLSVTMAEQLNSLRSWAQGRAVAAD